MSGLYHVVSIPSTLELITPRTLRCCYCCPGLSCNSVTSFVLYSLLRHDPSPELSPARIQPASVGSTGVVLLLE